MIRIYSKLTDIIFSARKIKKMLFLELELFLVGLDPMIQT